MLKACFTSPKLKALQRLLQCGLPATIGHLELLWQFTATHAPHGNVGRWTDAEIAGACEWEGQPEDFVKATVAARFLDAHSEHRLVVHDWGQHCPRWVKAVVAKSPNQFVGNGDYSADYRADYSGYCNTGNSENVPTTVATTEPTHTLPSPTLSFPPEGISCNQGKPDNGQMSPDEFKERWNKFAKAKGLTTIRKLTEDRRRHLRPRLASPTWMGEFRQALAKLPLPGPGWQPDFDWFIGNEQNVIKIIEGKYDWRGEKDGKPEDGPKVKSLEDLKKEGYRP